ncbi:hypothetical protein DH2020_039166 [Rehmannia glutinosa]|uniref:Ribosomal RNA processing protein 1-like protein n=1 Tax=Rehmannia glutinosa TaxID=99300 RepID=A0ABR0UWT0_REHGL
MRKRPREPKPILPVLASATGPALIKHLASCNTTVRSQALRLLQSWLVSQSQQLSDSDIKKLWKGLFYCLWHADKTPNQVALINRLTSLFLSLQPSLSLEFFRGFLVTLRREWPGIDRLRLDKFYLLIRRFMKALFELMRLRNWDVDVLGEYFGVLEKDGFLAEDKLQGNGVNYHVVSVFLEELKGVGFPVTKEVVDVMLGPFFAVMMSSKDRILLGKVKSCLFDELVKMGKEMLAKSKMEVDCDEKGGDMLLGVVALKMGLSERFFQVGSSVDCIQGNRKVVLGLHEEFLKLEKELESSGVEIAIPEYNGSGDLDEVPLLIPIDFGASNGNVETITQEGPEDACDEDDPSDNRISKKIKKAKKGMAGDDKKKKKKKKRKDDNGVSEINPMVEENSDLVSINGIENLQFHTDSGNFLSDDLESDGTEPALDENVILNLQKQFEKVAAEMDSKSDEDLDLSDAPLISVKRSKRKRAKRADAQEPGDLNTNGNADNGIDAAAKSVEKSSKKVRFSMKNNLVWKPQSPLPPESLRLPPSVTPRGSALKKGVPPGPIIEMPSVVKRAKKKKPQNRVRSATSMMKRRKKMQTRSA